jgi:hypothetical protein
MNSRQFQIAMENTRGPEARAHLERVKPLFDKVCQADRTFTDRVNASKSARGEEPTKLRKSRREEVAAYAGDAEEAEKGLTRDLAGLSGESAVWALSTALETELSFWSSQGLKHAHPAERPIIEELIQVKRRLLDELKEFLCLYPPEEHDED